MPRFLGIRRRTARRAVVRRPRAPMRTSRFSSFATRRMAARPRNADSIMTHQLVANPWARYMKASFPPRMRINDKYADVERTLSVTTAGVCNASFLYRLNDPFDPYNGVGGGGPPEWFTTLAAVYNKYLITSCDVEITYYAPTQNTLVAGALIHAADDADDPSGKTADYMLQRRNYACARLTSTSGEGSSRTVSAHIKCWEVEGLTYQQYVDQALSYGALVTTDPLKIIYCRIGAADINAANTGSCQMSITLTYHGYFYAPKTS